MVQTLTTIREKLSSYTPSAIARASGLPRSTVVDALKTDGNPTMRTMAALEKAAHELANQDRTKKKSRKPVGASAKAASK